MKQRAARIISYILMPTTFALFAFLLLTFSTRQNADRTTIAIISVVFGAVLPFLYLLLLLRKEKVSRIDVPIREQRTIPYIVSVLIYFLGFLTLFAAGASVTVYALMFCYATNTLIVSLINTRWKISAHAMGASGPLTALAATFGRDVLPLFLIVVVVAWARIEIRAHTKAQVTAGALLGILLTAVQIEVLYKVAGLRGG